LKTKRTLLVTPALIFIILTAIMPSSMISAKAEVQTYVFSVDPTIHDKYGLTYPVTYMFSLPNGASGLIAYRRFTLDESWVRIDEKTSNDLFNGIEAARFDYPNKKAYVSVALASYSDSIYIYFTDSNGNQINSNYLGTAPYYDNRGVTVVFTIDDLGAAPPWGVNEDFTEISTAFADAKVWWTGAVVTNSINDWQTLQDCVNRGYFEVASHSREHPDYTPYDNYDSEIGGSRDDICSNLTLAYSKGSQGYVWGWVEPSGKTDDTVQQKLTQYHYLVSRGTAEVFTPVNYPSWNSTFGIYDRSNTTVDMDFNSIYNLNGYFDSVYASGGIYHAWGHVGKLGWTSGGVGYEHLQYIAGKKDVWYVGYGALYAYAYTRDNFQTMSVTINPTTAYIAVGGSQEFTSTVTGRLSPYTYQWYYANGTAISGATTSSLAYKANFTGTYSIYLNITDSLNYKTQSNTATINVLFNIQGANALNSSWLSGWAFRKSHVINNVTGAGTNYLVQVTVYYGSGTDSGGNVYLNSLCQTNFGDVRFTASDGLTLLNYYMSSETASNKADFWVQDPDNLSNVNSTIYIYFGKSGAVTTSNGVATFNLFENASNNHWVDDWANNPILTPTAETWDAGNMWPLSFLYVNGTYYLYYTGSTTPSNVYTSGGIGVATSTDGIHFTKYSGNPIVSPTESGWLYSCNTPAVCYVNGTFYMLFTGYKSDAATSAAVLATSADGLNFTVYSSTPVLDDDASWINHHIESGGLSVFDGKFYFYYNINPNVGDTRMIGVATSTNCINWTVSPNNPVVTTTSGGYSSDNSACVTMPKVVKYGTLNGSPVYLMLISAITYGWSISDEHLDCLTSSTPMFNSTLNWHPILSGNVFQPRTGLDNPSPALSLDSVGDTVAYNNYLNIFYADGTNVRRATYESGGSIVNFVNWNRNNEVGTWIATNGYLQEAGNLFSKAYLWSNLPSMTDYRAVANFSITTGKSYDSYLLARTTSGSNGGSSYALNIAQNESLIQIYKVTSGTWNLLASTSYIPTSNIQVEFDVYGTNTVTLLGKVNGVEKIRVSDSSSPITSGGFGLACADQPGYTSKFSNIFVTNYVNPEPVQGAWGNQETNLLTASVSPTSWIIDADQSKTFTATPFGGSGIYMGYQWYVNRSAQFGQTASTFNYSSASLGSYLITVTVSDSLGATSAQLSNASVTVNSALVAPAASASPSTVDRGQFSSLTTTVVTTGTSSYTYQWLEKSPSGSYIRVGTNSSSFSFVTSDTTTTGSWSFILQVTDNVGAAVNSSAVSVTVNTVPTVSVSPTSWTAYVGQSQTFSSSVSGGTLQYFYQWYLNDTAVLGATIQNWTVTPTFAGHYSVYLEVTDALNVKVQSNIVTDITVFSQPTVSISPTSAGISLGSVKIFNSTVSGGAHPYTYQWYYANGTAISGATTSSLAYKANFTGTYSIYLNITDSLNYKTQSNTATINVYSHLNAFISPTQVTLYYGQSQTFSVLGNGGSAPYTYQWYINDTAIPGATNASWTFTPRENGNYRIYANLTDSYGVEATSNVVNNINVYSVHLMLNTEPQGTYAKGQQVTFKVTVLNQQNPKLETTLTLTITGPGDYGFYDFQPINMSANSVFEYSFNCVVPNVAGTYVVEVSLVPAQLTAYEAKWIEAGELPTGLGYSSTNSLVVSKSLVNGGYAIFVLVGSQALSGVYSLALPKYKGKKLRTFSRALPISRTNMLWRLTGRL
jgi:hypothetical protein